MNIQTEASFKSKILRIRQVCEATGLSKSTIYDHLNMKSSRYNPAFPKPIKLGENSVGWISYEVDDWIESLRSVRDCDGKP
jgi:prophage regulatory protein